MRLDKISKELFDTFLDEYLENVKIELPESYRAQQLKAGGIAKALVYKYERIFLEKPFIKAINTVLKLKEE